jgi:hypothetical protein
LNNFCSVSKKTKSRNRFGPASAFCEDNSNSGHNKSASNPTLDITLLHLLRSATVPIWNLLGCWLTSLAGASGELELHVGAFDFDSPSWSGWRMSLDTVVTIDTDRKWKSYTLNCLEQ